MTEVLSQAEWDAIGEDHKAVEPDGQHYVLRTDTHGRANVVLVQITPSSRRTVRTHPSSRLRKTVSAEPAQR